MRKREPLRRARSLLFLIESRTAYLASRARHAFQRFPAERLQEERELEFLEAYLAGREPRDPPTVQDLERHAPQWASLLPESPQVRATLARLLAEKYPLHLRKTPGIQRALGLHDPAVGRAFTQLYGKPMEQLWTRHLPWSERWRWFTGDVAHTLESLPPFWTAYAITLTEATGGAILSLPIAFSSVGLLGGVALLVIFGVINAITIGQLSEAVTRSGEVRYEHAFFGRLVERYLGPTGSVLLTASMATLLVLVAIIYYLGVATTLGDATGWPEELWAALLFASVMYFVTRPNLSTTVGSALIIGSVNIGLIILLSMFTLFSTGAAAVMEALRPAASLDFSAAGAALGAAVSAFYGHVSVGNCGRLVLQRDPSGRSLTWGSMAALLTAIVMYVFFVVAVFAAVPPDELAAEYGTALTPLARHVGPSARVMGSLFALLSMGLAAIYPALGLFNLVRERLPRPAAVAAASRHAPMGLQLSAVLDMPAEDRQVLTHLLRSGPATLSALATHLGRTEAGLQASLARLAGAGHVQEGVNPDGQRMFQVRLAGRNRPARPHQPYWEKLLDDPSRTSVLVRALVRLRQAWHHRMAALDDKGRYRLALAPVVGVFLMAEWSLWSESTSFTTWIAYTGVFVVTILAGFLPVLLIRATRRKGDLVPFYVIPHLGAPWILAVIYLTFLPFLLVHGLFFWRGTAVGMLALVLSAAMVIWPVFLSRRGVFQPHACVEIRRDPDGRGLFTVAVGGRTPSGTRIRFQGNEGNDGETLTTVEDFSSLREVSFRFPPGDARHLRLRVHQVDAYGETQPLLCQWEVGPVDPERGIVASPHAAGTSLDGLAQTSLPAGAAEVQVTVRLPLQPGTGTRG